MADCMMFPKDWHDFIKDYSFIDSEHIYTNGSELIQVLRVTQLIEHLLKEQEDERKRNPVIVCPHCGKRVNEMDIREVVGLWCDDITFCPERCGWESCPRNSRNIRDRSIPHSFSVEIPQDCPKKQKGGEAG